MPLTCFTGIMARRLLVNWRIDPAAACRVLPPGVRPALVGGYAVAGLCLVRLEKLRPVGLPAFVGLSSENVALRMGIEWDAPWGREKSVLIFRRESPSLINGAFCRFIGYGVHHHIALTAADEQGATRISGTSPQHTLLADVQPAERIHRDSIFPDLPSAEGFFRGSECGYSPTPHPGMWDRVRLQLHRWELHRLEVVEARSTLIDALFGGAAEVDSAFVMRDIAHTWIPCGRVPLGTAPHVPGLADERTMAAAA